MKKIAIACFLSILIGLWMPIPGMGQDQPTPEMEKELSNLKVRVQDLEDRFKKAPEKNPIPDAVHKESAIGVKGLADRVRRIEDQIAAKGSIVPWVDRIAFSGLLEVEASYEEMDFDDPAILDVDTGDLVLSTVELGLDVEIAKHVGGHLLFLWEEDDTDPVNIDEGFIILDGKEVWPLYRSRSLKPNKKTWFPC